MTTKRNTKSNSKSKASAAPTPAEVDTDAVVDSGEVKIDKRDQDLAQALLSGQARVVCVSIGQAAELTGDAQSLTMPKGTYSFVLWNAESARAAGFYRVSNWDGAK